MWRLPDPRFDTATALDRGTRDTQEDSVVADFPIGDDCGIVVLADGMVWSMRPARWPATSW